MNLDPITQSANRAAAQAGAAVTPREKKGSLYTLCACAAGFWGKNRGDVLMYQGLETKFRMAVQGAPGALTQKFLQVGFCGFSELQQVPSLSIQPSFASRAFGTRYDPSKLRDTRRMGRLVHQPVSGGRLISTSNDESAAPRCLHVPASSREAWAPEGPRQFF
jgi:hypothetical protein